MIFGAFPGAKFGALDRLFLVQNFVLSIVLFLVQSCVLSLCFS